MGMMAKQLQTPQAASGGSALNQAYGAAGPRPGVNPMMLSQMRSTPTNPYGMQALGAQGATPVGVPQYAKPMPGGIGQAVSAPIQSALSASQAAMGMFGRPQAGPMGSPVASPVANPVASPMRQPMGTNPMPYGGDSAGKLASQQRLAASLRRGPTTPSY